MIKIDKNIPIPEVNNGPSKYPFRDMVVGDSVPYNGDKVSAASATARGWAIRLGNGAKFTVRQLPDGIRIWRVK